MGRPERGQRSLGLDHVEEGDGVREKKSFATLNTRIRRPKSRKKEERDLGCVKRGPGQKGIGVDGDGMSVFQ